MDRLAAKVDEIAAAINSARAMPMSASCVVNRTELLGQLDELRALLPETLTEAQRVLTGRTALLDDARREAEHIIAAAREQQARMVQETEVAKEAQYEAARVTDEARAGAEKMRADVEAYVDTKLGNFEIVLTKTLAAVEKGRHQLSGRTDLDDLGDRQGDDAPLPS
ncbi:MAG TPA: hypothetical protein VNA30_01395 [Mycobacteriales bacterium]|nr:hypothetical protein [Mycobacteriales bacterium]